ncbi:MAG: endolytic transglycosylase MltG, partial [Pseudomonadota bacterium]
LCAAAYFGKYWFERPGPLETARTLVIEEGSSVAQISSKLLSNGVIDNDMIFRAWVRAYQAQGSLRAGEYLFEPEMSMLDVMETIRSGKGILHKVSIPEGWTVFQVFERLRENQILEGDLPEEMPAEGSLMPDTYPFQRGTTRVEVIERMKKAQSDFLAEVWERRIDGLPISTPEEMVILASIVEKETGKADERPRVASVFINRLNKGMRLQSDPTILYGIFGGEGKPSDRPIFKSDIETPTPYNTYTIPALPPGPIANPGRASLEAVANPSRTEDLFFVANGTGGHAFAKTLDEHNQNVARWRAIEAQQKKEAEEQATSDSAESSGSD